MSINYRGVWTLIKKELIRIKDIWKQSLLAPVISNLLFFVVFGVAIAGRVSDSGAAGNYFSVLVPGLVVMGLMMNSLQNPIFSLVISKYSNNIGDLLVLPLTGIELAFSYLFGGVFRGVAVGTVTLIVGTFFSQLPFAHPFLILLFTLLIGGAFASLGAIIGVIADDFDKANLVPTFIVQPLIYLGGVFYSVQELPSFLAKLSHFNPIFYMVDGFRYGFLGTGDIALWMSLGVTTIVFLICFLTASWMFHTGYKLRS